MGRPPLPLGARTLDGAGYWRIKVGDLPLAVAGWEREHRLVLWAELGPGAHPCYRCGRLVEWGRDLEVDHVDHDRQNNDPVNLCPACWDCQNGHRRMGVRNKLGGPR